MSGRSWVQEMVRAERQEESLRSAALAESPFAVGDAVSSRDGVPGQVVAIDASVPSELLYEVVWGDDGRHDVRCASELEA